MEEITEALLRIDSNDAVIVADKYISYKYIELFSCIGLIYAFILTLIIGGFFGYKLIKASIKNI